MTTTTVPSFVTIEEAVWRWRVVEVGVPASEGCGCGNRFDEPLEDAGDDVGGRVGDR